MAYKGAIFLVTKLCENQYFYSDYLNKIVVQSVEYE